MVLCRCENRNCLVEAAQSETAFILAVTLPSIETSLNRRLVCDAMNALERASFAHRGKFLCHSGDALLMAPQMGLPPLDFGSMTGRGKRVYIAGIHSAMNLDYSSLTAMMARVIARSKRRAASSGR
jgi:hypothetical protein